MEAPQSQLFGLQAATRNRTNCTIFPVVQSEKVTSGLVMNEQRTPEGTLQSIFPKRQEETQLQRGRSIMGDTILGLSDEELETYMTEFQLLINSWLDDYERQVFNGLTLQQMLREE